MAVGVGSPWRDARPVMRIEARGRDESGAVPQGPRRAPKAPDVPATLLKELRTDYGPGQPLGDRPEVRAWLESLASGVR
jgi:hypothetical protein